MSTRSQIIQTALHWVDTPYHHHAMVRGVGVDCAMLVVACAVAANCIDADQIRSIVNYPIEWHLHNHEEKLLHQIEELGAILSTKEKAKAGDIVTFKYGRTTSHLGILISETEFVHADSTYGKVVQSTLSGDYAARWTHVYRFPGVID